MKELKRSMNERATLQKGKRIINLKDCDVLARQYNISLKEIEVLALKEAIIPARYERNTGTIGIEGQLKLLNSRIAVIGCGGLGGVIIEILARAGAGELVLADGDVFSDSNLNRQLLSETGNTGYAKVEIASERIRRINPAIKVYPFKTFFNEETGPEILHGVQYVADALDNNPSRKILYHLCGELDIPVVHGAIGGFMGQVGVYMPGELTHLDFFGEGISEKGAEEIAGVPSFAPYLIGSMEAGEIIKLVTGAGEILREKLWIIDPSQLMSEFLSLGK